MGEQFLIAEYAQTRGHVANASFMRLMRVCCKCVIGVCDLVNVANATMLMMRHVCRAML